MAQWSNEDIQQAVKQICEKSIGDAGFYAMAIANPNRAIKEATGKEVPSNTKIRFVPLEDADLAFVLPTPESCSGELSESDLESVAGGRGGAFGIPGAVIGALTGGAIDIS